MKTEKYIKTLKIPSDKIDIIQCGCGQWIFIAHGKLEEFEEKEK